MQSILINNIMKSGLCIGLPCTCAALIFVLAMLTPGLATTCSITCTTTTANCTVCFQDCGGDYSYHNCSQSSSAATSSSSAVVYTEGECTQNCCSSQLSSFNVNKLAECDQQSSMVTIIIVSVLVFIVALVCICSCSPTLRQKCAACLCRQALVEPHRPCFQKRQSFSFSSKVNNDIVPSKTSIHVEPQINEKEMGDSYLRQSCGSEAHN